MANIGLAQQLKFYKNLALNDTVDIKRIMTVTDSEHMLSAIKPLGPTISSIWYCCLFKIADNGSPFWERYVALRRVQF